MSDNIKPKTGGVESSVEVSGDTESSSGKLDPLDDSGVGSSMSDIRLSKTSITASVVNVTPDVVKLQRVEDSPAKSSDSDNYMAGECTLLELLEEEYRRSQGEKQKASKNSSNKDGKKTKGSKGTKLGMGAKKIMGTEKKPPESLHVSSSSPELSALGSERPRSLVSPVADKTIK